MWQYGFTSGAVVVLVVLAGFLVAVICGLWVLDNRITRRARGAGGTAAQELAALTRGRHVDAGKASPVVLAWAAAVLVGVAMVPLYVGVVVGGLGGDADRGKRMGSVLGVDQVTTMVQVAAVVLLLSYGWDRLVPVLRRRRQARQERAHVLVGQAVADEVLAGSR